MEKIAHYIIESKLGEGAMGEVYRGLDENLKMPVAIKVLGPTVSSDQETLARFEIEARAAANLQHQNISHVFFIGRTDDNRPFYAMELIDGQALADIIHKRLKISGRQMLSLMLQSAQALKFACDKNVMHRDIKPGNIMVTNEGVVKLVDFGLAKLAESDNSLTKTGMALGTPNYLSPELAQGIDSDFRSDMYSLGITFFELLTGKIPYESGNPMGVLMKHVREPIPDISSINRKYPVSLCKLIERMMAKQPEDRFANYQEIITQLEKITHTEREFVNAEWSFCEHCGYVTCADESDRCSRCNEPYGEVEKTETLCNVRLVRFENRKAMNDVAEHMKRTTRKPPEVIRRMLQHLPLLLGTKLTLEQGKALQLKFYGMGAQIDIEKVVHTTKAKKTNRMSMTIDGPALERPELEVKQPVKSNKTRFAMVAVLMVLLVASVSIYYFSFYSAAKTDARQANVTTGKIIDNNKELAKNAAAIGELKVIDDNEDQAGVANSPSVINVTSDRGIFNIRSIDFGDKETLEKIAHLLEENLSRIGMVLGSMPEGNFKVTLDGRQPFGQMLPYFGLAVEDVPGKIMIYSKGLDLEDRNFKAILVSLLSRAILRNWGGANLPLWFEAGFSLSMLNRTLPQSYDSKSAVKNMSQYLDDELWLDEFGKGSNIAYAQAADFTSYLMDNYNLNHMQSLAQNVKNGYDMDSAIKSVYGFEKSKLMNDWFARR